MVNLLLVLGSVNRGVVSRICVQNVQYSKKIGEHTSGQIIATSHDLTQNGGLVREIPLFQGNPGWWNIIIWPDTCITTLIGIFVQKDFCSKPKKTQANILDLRLIYPLPRMPVTTRIFTVNILRLGDPELNLHFPLLLGLATFFCWHGYAIRRDWKREFHSHWEICFNSHKVDPTKTKKAKSTLQEISLNLSI